MSQALIVAFSPEEISSGQAFGQALGIPFKTLLLTGSAGVNSSSADILEAGLETLPTADSLTPAILALLHGYTHVAAVASMKSKDLLARLAGQWDAAMVSDVIEVKSATQFLRPMAAGAVLATVEVIEGPVVLTFRPAGFKSADANTAGAVSKIDLNLSNGSRRVTEATRSAARPALTQAKVIVSGGRPLKTAESFEVVIGGLADALGGAVGSTRAAVDAGIAPNELQVGQTGKIVAPDLYIAAGISGSTQHMAGIKDSKIIVAINKDADAPIFQFADFGLVADLFDAVPRFQELVTQ
jgi:electron transfer flavoprotein alpha subunit